MKSKEYHSCEKYIEKIISLTIILKKIKTFSFLLFYSSLLLLLLLRLENDIKVLTEVQIMRRKEIETFMTNLQLHLLVITNNVNSICYNSIIHKYNKEECNV